MIIVLATRNPSKTEQIKAVFHNSQFTIKTLTEAGIEGEAVEDGATLEENALKKARYAFRRLKEKQWVMADDTGLFIDALHGEPGVHSAYWGGRNLSTEQILAYGLERMKNIRDRRATFKTVVAVISPEGKEYMFHAEVKGNLLETPRVKFQPKMPYSSLFVPEGFQKSWAEMSVDEENKISHRGRAFQKVKLALSKLSQ